jgi:hypothetical protein
MAKAKNTALTAFKSGLQTRLSKKRHKPKMTVSLATLAGFVPTGGYALAGFRRGGEAGLTEGIARITVRLTGYSITEEKFHGSELARGWGPVLLGFGVHKLANKIGINRQIARMGIPLLRI